MFHKNLFRLMSLIIVIHHNQASQFNEGEEIIEDFDVGESSIWNNIGVNTSFWYPQSTEGNNVPPKYPSLVPSVRPPINSAAGTGFVEVIPLFPTPAQLEYKDHLDLLPGATVQLTYWTAANSGSRRTTLQFYKIIGSSLQVVFTAPRPTSISTNWITVTIDLLVTEPVTAQVI